MKGNFRTGVLRLTPMETICLGQMLLNLYPPPPQAGTGGPAARPYGVGVGHCLFDRLDGDAVVTAKEGRLYGRSSFVIQGRGFIRKSLLAGSWTATA